MEVVEMKVAYPTIFTDVGKNILIEVPDLGILTEANEEGKRKIQIQTWIHPYIRRMRHWYR